MFKNNPIEYLTPCLGNSNTDLYRRSDLDFFAILAECISEVPASLRSLQLTNAGILDSITGSIHFFTALAKGSFWNHLVELKLDNFEFDSTIYFLQHVSMPHLKKLSWTRSKRHSNNFFINPIPSLREFENYPHGSYFDGLNTENQGVDLNIFLNAFPNLTNFYVCRTNDLVNFKPSKNCKHLRRVQIESKQLEIDASFLLELSQLPNLEWCSFSDDTKFKLTNQLNISSINFENLSELHIASCFLSETKINAKWLRKLVIKCEGSFSYNFSDFPYLEELELNCIPVIFFYNMFKENSLDMKHLCRIYAMLKEIAEEYFKCPPGPANTSVLEIDIQCEMYGTLQLGDSFYTRFPNL